MRSALAPAPLVRPAPPVDVRREVLPPPAPTSSNTAPDVPTHRSVQAHVTGGLDGALRVMTLLRARRYPVCGLTLDVDEDESRVTCTVASTATEVDLLLARLRRLPAVVSAHAV